MHQCDHTDFCLQPASKHAPVPDKSNSPLYNNGWEACQFEPILYMLLLNRTELNE